ncbi:YeiH family protein [Psychrobacter sp. I-STPA6b]|uniref:YeiH family protein n=1 Tax=Psychrobacter sp. I-STPA6b TaxID=2585718 RepID=UPI001D0C983E|nr:YeiH family protein [Psychrobacter sp. I-STPA6b]
MTAININKEQNHPNNRQSFIIGLILVLAISLLCMLLGKVSWLSSLGFSTLTLAIALGMLVGNTLYPRWENKCHAGVLFSKGKLLKLGIILYGFHLTLSQIGQVGVASIVADALILTSTFALTYILACKVFAIDQHTAILMGAGCSICGAAAVLATEPVLKADSDKVAVAIAVVVIFGTLAIFLYPAMYHWGLWDFVDKQWGIYIGSSVHEVAQVYAAGHAINDEVENIAVTAKMIRVMMLAPFLILVSIFVSRQATKQQMAEVTNNTNAINTTDATNSLEHSENTKKLANKITIPWFAILFIVMVAVNSLNIIPQTVVQGLLTLDQWLLTMAMVALGLTTHISAIKRAGIKPMILGAIVMMWLVVGGGFIQLVVG